MRQSAGANRAEGVGIVRSLYGAAIVAGVQERLHVGVGTWDGTVFDVACGAAAVVLQDVAEVRIVAVARHIGRVEVQAEGVASVARGDTEMNRFIEIPMKARWTICLSHFEADRSGSGCHHFDDVC